MLPYSRHRQCFVCQERFKLVKEKDDWYLLNAKMIKVNKVKVRIHATTCSKLIDELAQQTADTEAPEEM